MLVAYEWCGRRLPALEDWAKFLDVCIDENSNFLRGPNGDQVLYPIGDVVGVAKGQLSDNYVVNLLNIDEPKHGRPIGLGTNLEQASQHVIRILGASTFFGTKLVEVDVRAVLLIHISAEEGNTNLAHVIADEQASM